MPKRNDIHSVLIIGAGPIIIGQACEFDYSGTQACKALREEGYRVILINSNPATIMTDPEFADRTYIEPITPECVEKITIIREKEEMKRSSGPRANWFCFPPSAARPRSTPPCPCTKMARFSVTTRRDDRYQAWRPSIRRRRPPRLQGIDARDRPRCAHFPAWPTTWMKPAPSPTRSAEVFAHHPSRVHPRRHRRRHRLPSDEFEAIAKGGIELSPCERDPHRRIAPRLEGIRDGS